MQVSPKPNEVTSDKQQNSNTTPNKPKKRAKKSRSERKKKAAQAAEKDQNNEKIESSEAEVNNEPPKVYIDAPPPKENAWLKKQKDQKVVESTNNKNQEVSSNNKNNDTKNIEQKIKPAADLEQVMKNSTAENRPPPPAKPLTQPQPQLPVVSNLTKSIVTKSSSGSPWKTTPVEQNSAQVRRNLIWQIVQFGYYE